MDQTLLRIEQPGGALDSAWCALYTRHQHEKTVAGALTAKGFEVLLPLYKSIRTWKDRNKVIELALFPCYVFVRGAITRRLQVLTTPGVHMVLAHGDRIAIIPEEQIHALQRLVNGSQAIEPHPFLQCGERVRVKRGALEGVEGILVRKKNLCRLILSVDTVSRSISVEINALDVEVVPPTRSPLDGRVACPDFSRDESRHYSRAAAGAGCSAF
jgi:transcription antitermination factor NusG